jgi:hypothetical protein
MITELIHLIENNPGNTLAVLGVLLTAVSLLITLIIHRESNDNNFYDRLENDSLYQINESYKNIDRILTQALFMESELTLFDLEDIKTQAQSNDMGKILIQLAPYFAEYCSHLDKYSNNILPQKKVCFTFQEHSKKARALLSIFQENDYDDVSLLIAIHHLKSAKIIN